MNIYQKMNEVKIALQAKSLKKSGKNTFAKYDYYELADFLPTLVSLCDGVKIHCAISFTADTATLIITNVEKPDEQIIITSPMGSADLKGCHVVQNIGAVETYQRRYLYCAAFDIVEHDALDATTGKQEPKQPATQAPKSEKVMCECGKPISFGKVDPKKWIEKSKTTYGAVLCKGCIDKKKAMAE